MRADPRAPRRDFRHSLLGAALLAACAGTAAPDPAQIAVRRWLLCEECVHGELQALQDPSRHDRIVPLLASALAGPSRASRLNVQRQLEDTYERLAARAGERGEVLPVTREQYVAHFLGNYEAVYQSRSVVALAAIGTPEARRVLADAAERVRKGQTFYRGDVLEELGRVTGNAAVGGSALWTSITAGSRHTCGTRTDGQSYCWGRNSSGQLGDSTTAGRTRPARVATPLRFSSVVTAAGGSHTCGLAKDRLYCWGNNDEGTLGDSTNILRTIPTAVSGGLTFAGVAVGGSHTCAWTGNGEAYCWGQNRSGQLGDGSTTNRTWPRRAADSLRFRTVSAGASHTCAATVDGRPYCWGNNPDGQLGSGSRLNSSVPSRMVPPLRFASLGLGRLHTCGLTGPGPVTPDGITYCVGGNGEGQVGDDTAIPRDSLTRVVGNHRFFAISVGSRHACGITAMRSLWCWGDNAAGQLGDSTSTNRSGPVLVKGDLRYALVSAGGSHTCAVTVQGTVYCWGLNQGGQLGDGTVMSRPVPTRVLTP